MPALPEIFGPPPDHIVIPPGVLADFTLDDGSTPADFALIPQGAIKVQVRPLPQSTDYSCGACSLAAVAEYFGLAHGDPLTVENDFISLCKTDPDEGTSPAHLEEAARDLGLRVLQVGENLTRTDLEGWLSQSVPVIVDLQAWGPLGHPDYADDRDDGHYVVVIGFDADTVFFEDPVLPDTRASLPWDIFLRAWHDVDDGKTTSRWGMALSRDEEATPME